MRQNVENQPRSYKRILIDTVVFSSLLILLLVFVTDKEDDIVKTGKDVKTEISVSEAKTLNIF